MKVYLVGAGPGDPGLITVKGKKVLERADAVLYDNLASDRLLEHAPPHAERIYVGKKRAQHEMSQEEISALMIDRARRGWTVVRLKGGDPFIFARGGEEMEALAAAGIPFEIVPGVTTPLGLAAYTGVPLTHRQHTSAVTFVTGHNVEAIDWGKVGSAETVVLFMGLVNFAAIAREMIARGRSAQDARHGGALGHAPGSGNAGRDSGDSAGQDRAKRPEAAGDHRHRRSGLAARPFQLVRAAAAVRPAHRRDARPPAGRRIGGAPGRAGRGSAPAAGDRDPAARRPRAARSRHRLPRYL